VKPEQTLASLIEEAQNEPVCLARQGKPVAVLQGVEGNDLETVLLEHSRTFWEEIERRRSRRGPGAPWRPFAADYFADDGVLVAQQTTSVDAIGLGSTLPVSAVWL